MAKKKTAKKKTTRKKAAKKKTAKRKAPAAAQGEPTQEGKERFRQLIQAAHDNVHAVKWARRIIMDCGWIRKLDKATKADMQNFARACGGVFEKMIERVAETDKELAKTIHELAKSEMEKLDG